MSTAVSAAAAAAPPILVRDFSVDRDLEMVRQWHHAHCGQPFPAALMSPLGVLAQDCGGPACVVWAHLSAGCGVAHLEQPLSRPGMGLAQARAAFSAAMDCLERILAAHDYRLLVCYPRRRLGDVLVRWFGFDGDGHIFYKALAPKPNKEEH